MKNRLKLPVIIACAAFTAVAFFSIAIFYQAPHNDLFALATNVVKKQTGLIIKAGRLETGLPFRVKIPSLVISIPGQDQVEHPIISFDSLNCSFSVLNLVFGKVSMDFKMASPDGTIEGSVDYRFLGEDQLTINVDKMSMQDLVVSGPDRTGTLKGALKGDCFFILDNNFIPLSGKGRIEINNGTIDDFNIKELPVNSYDFNSITTEFHVENGIVYVDNFEADGPQGGAVLKGDIKNLKNPYISFNGDAFLGSREQPLGKTRISILGSIRNPKINVSGLTGLKLQ